MWFNREMSSSSESLPTKPTAPADGVENWQRLVSEQQQTIQALQLSIEKMERQLKQQQERIEQLEAELRAQKKLKGKPKIRPSQLNTPQRNPEGEDQGKRPGSAKVSKKSRFQIDEERIIQPDQIPVGAKFNGYRDYDVQELKIERHNIRFRLAEYVSSDGTTIVGQLPAEYSNGHYGPLLLGYILYQHYQCRVPQSLLHEQLQEWGIDISVGQLNNILSENKEKFHAQQQVLRVGLETAQYVHTDDTGARHQGKNGYCTVIGNQWFSYFKSSGSKSRQNFLEVLQGGAPRYVLNEYAQQYLESQPLAAKYREQLTFSDALLAEQTIDWQAYLLEKGIVSAKAVQVISEAALLGGVMSQGINAPLRILSDGAGQFNVLCHGLCWVHAERSLRRLQGNTARQRQNIAEMQDLLWQYYRQLQQYQQHPTSIGQTQLWQAFDQVFGRCYLHHDSLNIVLNWFKTHKTELLQVLDYPQFPLHNNEAETDIRAFCDTPKD